MPRDGTRGEQEHRQEQQGRTRPPGGALRRLTHRRRLRPRPRAPPDGPFFGRGPLSAARRSLPRPLCPRRLTAALGAALPAAQAVEPWMGGVRAGFHLGGAGAPIHQGEVHLPPRQVHAAQLHRGRLPHPHPPSIAEHQRVQALVEARANAQALGGHQALDMLRVQLDEHPEVRHSRNRRSKRLPHPWVALRAPHRRR